jgi:hypothetical protein
MKSELQIEADEADCKSRKTEIEKGRLREGVKE